MKKYPPYQQVQKFPKPNDIPITDIAAPKHYKQGSVCLKHYSDLYRKGKLDGQKDRTGLAHAPYLPENIHNYTILFGCCIWPTLTQATLS